MRFITTTLRVLLGLLIVLIGVWSAFDQSARKVATEGAITELQAQAAAGLPIITADALSDLYDGEPVLVHGELAPASVTDPLTGLTVEAVWLKRLVELRQWKQHADCRSSFRNSGSGQDCDYWWERVWSWDLIDSDNFAKPLLGENPHVNPKEKPFDEPTFVARTAELGAWALDTAYFSRAFERGAVSADEMTGAELEADWRADASYIYSRELSDVRIRYDAVKAPTGSVSVIAIPENGRLTLTEELAGVPLLVSGNVDAATIVEAATGEVRDIQQHWIFYTFAGLMLLIRPVARLFSGLNDFTYAPAGKRLIMTAGVAAAITAIVGLLLPS